MNKLAHRNTNRLSGRSVALKTYACFILHQSKKFCFAVYFYTVQYYDFAVCGFNALVDSISSFRATFNSPGYSRTHYTNNLDCTWIFSTTRDLKLNITFLGRFSTEATFDELLVRCTSLFDNVRKAYTLLLFLIFFCF